MLDHAEIVADEQIGQIQFAPQIHKEVEDLRLDGNVERGDRLVANQEIGLHGKRAGDTDALALAAGELVRIAALERGIETGALQLRVEIVVEVGAADEAMDEAAPRRRCRATRKRGFSEAYGS